jgi:hypothetical protein
VPKEKTAGHNSSHFVVAIILMFLSLPETAQHLILESLGRADYNRK